MRTPAYGARPGWRGTPPTHTQPHAKQLSLVFRGEARPSAVGPWEPGQDREATDDLELATEGEDGTEVHLRARRRRRRLWKVGDISLGRGGGHHSSTNLPLCCFVNIICLTSESCSCLLCPCVPYRDKTLSVWEEKKINFPPDWFVYPPAQTPSFSFSPFWLILAVLRRFQ